ncbi:MAG: carboxypeptidase regulatory-like domain-containing protein, partial [Rhodothermales bacterium]
MVLVFALGDLSAQQTGTVTGVVTDARDGRPLSAVQVQLRALQRGVLTNAEGRYTLENVPVGEHELTVDRLGYQATTQTVQVGADASAAVNFALIMRAISMEGVVATGVASETPRSQLAFTVARLNVDEIQRVPTPSVAGLLQAKVPGAKVVQGSGMPGQEPS